MPTAAVWSPGANLSPDNLCWREGFVRLQERGRVVFSAAVDGKVYARHGTTTMLLAAMAQTYWTETGPDDFASAWEAEIAALPAFADSTLHVVTGLLLPIWKQLPNDSMRVYRLQTDDGERSIGRLVSPAWFAQKADAEVPALDAFAAVHGGQDGSRWISCKPNFLLPVRVLSKLFRRLMLTKLEAAHAAGQLQFFGVHAHLADAKAFAAFLTPLKKTRWFVYSKRPFAGPKAVLAYLSRYTHRVAISNRRLIAFDGRQVTFKVKDYRVEGPGRYTTMTLDVDEFICHFLIHVLPKGFHRIRHYGLFAGSNRAETIKDVREFLNPDPPAADASTKAQQTRETDSAQPLAQPCPCCGGRMFVIETFEPGCSPRHQPTTSLVPIRIDTS